MQKYIGVLFLLCLGGCASAPRQSINLSVNAIFASPEQINVIHCASGNVAGFFIVNTSTMVIPTPRDWNDHDAMETIGHEFMHMFYDHKSKDYWLPGNGAFIER